MTFSTATVIERTTPVVWKTLTDPSMMIQWMGDPEMQLSIETTWQIHSPIVIRGFHHASFENRGVVFEFIPEKSLRYTHLSSLSRLPDVQENYSIIGFELTSIEDWTGLTITIENFPTDSIRNHLEFYWRGTMPLIKMVAESRVSM